MIQIDKACLSNYRALTKHGFMDFYVRAKSINLQKKTYYSRADADIAETISKNLNIRFSYSSALRENFQPLF